MSQIVPQFLVRLVRPAFLRAVARGAALAVVTTWAVFVLSGQGGPSTKHGWFGGDFPAFYGAGVQILGGHGRELYETASQQRAQHDLLKNCGPRCFLMFAYPAPVALVYAQFARLPYRMAYALHTVLMLAALGVALWTLRSVYGEEGLDPLAVLGALLVCPPVFVGLFLGQNSMLSLFLIAMLWLAVSKKRDVVGGVVLALLMFKPQFAVPLLASFVCARRWQLAFATVATTAVLYLAAVPACGWDWGRAWLSWALHFRDIDATLNGPRGVSWISYIEGALGNQPWMQALAVGVAAATFAFMALVWFRRVWTVPALLLATSACVVFGAPHAMRYDLTLAAPSALWLLPRHPGKVFVAYVSAALSEYYAGFGAFALALLIGVAAMEALQRSREALPGAAV